MLSQGGLQSKLLKCCLTQFFFYFAEKKIVKVCGSVCVCGVGEKERKKERYTHTKKDRERNRQTDRQTGKLTNTDSETHKGFVT